MPSQRHTFPRTHRLSGSPAFTRVFDARTRDGRGPVMVHAVPNDLPHPRLGLSISRAVGTAPRRNRIKRLLREAFRMHQHDLPIGYDLVITVRPHKPLLLADYQRILTAAMIRLHRVWSERAPREDRAPDRV